MVTDAERLDPREEKVKQRFFVLNGTDLRTRLFGSFRHPNLTKATIVTYRYHDFDYMRGRVNSESLDSVINILCKAAEEHRVDITFVTRDPLTEQSMGAREARFWYRGLERLQKAIGSDVLIHSALHAKMYLTEMSDDRRFYAVGSSNLTYQGMGYRWAECNIAGYAAIDYIEVEKSAKKIIFQGKNIQTLDDWSRNARKRQGNRAIPFFMD